MTEWLGLIISFISLVITLVVEREKLASALKDLRIWRREQKELAELRSTINRLGKVDEEPKASKFSSLLAFAVTFLLFVIASGIAGLFTLTTFTGIFLASLGMLLPFFALTMIVTIKNEAGAPAAHWYEWFLFTMLMAFGLTLVGAVWAGITILVRDNSSLDMFWAGVIASAVIGLLAFAPAKQ